MKFSDLTDHLKRYPLAVISAVLIACFAVIIFLRGDIASELLAKESELDTRINKINENIKNSTGLQQDVEDLAAIVEKMDTLLFDRYERAMNISFFYEFEDKADVVISNISQLSEPDPIYSKVGPRKLDLHSTLVYNLTVTGSFTNILQFFYEIGRAEPFIRIADCELSHGGEKLGAQGVNARLRVLVMAEIN